MERVRVECESRIDRVAVHARGALVRRRVTLPPSLPGTDVEIVVPGVSAAADPGSLRAEVAPGRNVIAVRARLIVPMAQVAPGVALDRLRQLHLDRQAVLDRRAAVAARRKQFMALELEPGFARRSRIVDPEARTGDALAAAALISERVAALDDTLRSLDENLERIAREIEHADLEAQQARSIDRAGIGHPRYELSVLLGVGDGVPAWLDVEYAVTAARWWPAYTARFGPGTTRVTFSLDAFVAQSTGEDWTGVALAVTTADLIHDARLPELPSLRLGRAQPPPRRGYRPPPGDTEVLFAGFRRAAERYFASKPMASFGVIEEREDAEVPHGVATATGTIARELTAGALPLGGAAPPPPPGAAPMPQAAAAMPMQPMARAKSAGVLGAVADMLEGAGGGGSRAFEAQEPSAIEPEDAWLDFDAITIAGVDDAARVGRLVKRKPEEEPALVRGARARIDVLDAPSGAPDPREARGQFDHRYDAAGTLEIPSDASPHRVTLASADAAVNTRFRAVPRATLDVFREAEIRNPFAAPLLGGPVDVFIDGALSSASTLSPVDRGGTISLGIGVENRIRLARNARVDESNAGLLGGSTFVDHTVTIEAVSSLGRTVSLDVIERVPVSDDREVEVSVSSAKPPFEKYEQLDRGAPVRRGVRWSLEIVPGGTARIEYAYRIALPAKSEIVGGNRRE